MVYTRLQKKMDVAAAAIPATVTIPDTTATHVTAMHDAAPLSIAQIKTRSKTQAIQKETLRQDEIIAALALLAIHDMHDQPNADWFPDTAPSEYQTQNRNNYTCNIL